MDPFRAAFEQSPDAMALLKVDDGGLRVVAVNAAFVRDTGADRNQVIGGRLADILAPTEAARLDALLRKVPATGSSVDFEQALTTPSGSLTWHIRAGALGQATQPMLVVAARDITFSRNFAQQLNAVASHMPGFVYQICRSADGDFRYTFVGERVESFFGISVEEVLADAQALLGRIHPDDMQRVMDGRAHSAQSLEPWRCEFRMRHRDGHIVWIEANDIPQRLAEGATLWTGYANDISERKSLEASLQASEMRFRRLVENANDLIMVIQREGLIDYVSPNTASLLGIAPTRISGRRLAEFVHADDRQRLMSYLDKALAGNRPAGGVDYRIQHQDGRWIWQTANASPLPSADGLIDSVIAISRDISRRQAIEAEFRKLAQVDTVTGLANRQEFMLRLDQAIAMARQDGEALALLFIDLDRFKPVNDTHGHAVGDALLRQVGIRLMREVRASDLVARLGGDEFTILLGSARHAQDALHVAEKLCHTLEMPFQLGEIQASISASAGVALFPEHGRTSAALVAAADKAMYLAKTHGRNRAVLAPCPADAETGHSPPAQP